MSSMVLLGVTPLLTVLSDTLFLWVNSISGRSLVLDTLLVLPVENQLVKAGLVGGCFLGAWFAGTAGDALRRNRRILLITLCASVFVVATTKVLSKTIFLPRPYIQSQRTFHLSGDRLVEGPRLPYRVPLDTSSQEDFQNLLTGNIRPNDFGSFPSDHAGFYVTLAAGVWLASRRLGWVALAWTFVVILGPRVTSGMHSPIDVIVGAGIGILILLACQRTMGWMFRRPLDGVVEWTLRQPVLSSVLIFVVAFESANTLEDVRQLLRTGASIGRQLLGG